MSTKPVIRWATLQDVPEILVMIKELAVFERAADKVEATLETLEASLSLANSAADPNPTFTKGYAKVILIVIPASGSHPEQIAGFSVFTTTFSTWLARPGVHLEDLFVRPDFRRKGFATLLLQRLAAESAKINEGKGRLEWNCLKWNENALKFYAGIGGQRMDEWVGIRVEGKGLKNLTDMSI